MLIDGTTVSVGSGATILEACDAAGRYVPRLCHCPGFGCCAGKGADGAEPCLSTECGLCAVRLGDGSSVLACATVAAPGMDITTDDPGLRALRLERLAPILSRHPHICLSCPDRDGCARDECSYGIEPEARCCDEFGRCELGRLVARVDTTLALARTAVVVVRDAIVEGRIRRESGLCVGCGRCVRVCDGSRAAGRALELVQMAAGDGQTREDGAPRPLVAFPKRGTLCASGCTFCGQCVLVCPAGALTAPGEAGARWLADRRERSGLAAPLLPPEERRPFSPDRVAGVPHEAGVFQLFDRGGEVLRIGGVADLCRGLTEALADPACVSAVSFRVEVEPFFTQRESELLAQYVKGKGHLPPGNDLGDELFEDE
jgi:predicted molibdopterin-dependent oxidoreductase YjgC